jgi:MFS family permease
MAAFAVDNYGSGLFLPLALLYSTRVVGLSIQTAGTVVAAATVVGFLGPPVAGRLAHHHGARPVVALAQLLQGAGAVLYLAASSAVWVFAAAALMSTGLQFFYSTLTLLVSDATASAAKERSFARVGQVRAFAFGLGNLTAALALAWGGDAVLRWLVGLDAMTFLVAAAVLLVLVDVRRLDHGGVAATRTLTVLRDRRYLALMAATFLLALTLDVAPVGLPVFSADVLDGPAWLGSAVLAFTTTLSSLIGVRVVERVRGRRRTRTLQLAALLLAGWSALTALMVWLPRAWVVPYALVVSVVMVAGTKLFFPMTGALSDALPPRHGRAGYLATFQYSFTLAQVAAPAVVGLVAVAGWLPWLLLVATNLLGCWLAGGIGARLPATVNRAPAERVPA